MLYKPAASPRENVLTTVLPPVTLILGGARSGKSAHAEALVTGSGLLAVYVATAQPLDDEMRARIDRHRERRGSAWRTIEEPLELPDAIGREAGPGRAVLVDCLTLWLTNLLLAGRDADAAGDALVSALERRDGPVVLVANEVGSGIVPLGELSRAFVDHAGRLHQRIAASADRVRLMVAGLPLDLKPPCIS
ncbi:MAG: bifunctional adenosylcobinamide kinase/adenosylcobinamide-phosphate guanylyltransferase [Geminicoccaceae bacterium]